MFGQNEIVGKRFFKEAPSRSLFVTSMFMTLQGEGPFRGQPAFFIRLAKCNLACSFCDTYFDGGDWMTFEDIDAKIKATIFEYFAGEVPTYAHRGLWGNFEREMVLVITGGEPMLQDNLAEFTKYIGDQFTSIQIESNGTLLQDVSNKTTLVVSPKCAEKDGKATKYLEPKAEVLKRASCLKFVMSNDQDSPYSQIPQWAKIWQEDTGRPIFISPMNIYNRAPEASKIIRMHKQGDINLDERSKVDEVISFWEPGLLDMKANQANHEYAARYCIQHGYTFNMQLHLFASLA